MYKINETFLSIQGEGIRTGTLNVFVRFAHCNLKCNLAEHNFNCDTEFTGGRPLNLAEVVTEIEEVGKGCKSVIFTGGEPSLQLDLALCDALRDAGYYLAIETNGTGNISTLNLDWITVSPKSAAHTLQVTTCDELKYVLGDKAALPVPGIKATHYLISPVFDGLQIDRASLAWCIKLLKENVTWRLSVQNHKFWRQR